MSDEKKKDVLDEMADGIGSLFKRAKEAAAHIPTEKIESAVASSAQKVADAAKHAADKVPTAAIEAAVLGGARVVTTAARTAASHIPTEKIEEAVLTGAREVGRALESVAHTIEVGIRGEQAQEGAEKPKPEGAQAEGGGAAKADEKPGDVSGGEGI